MTESERIFRLSKPELLGLAGVALFVLSLFLPAAKMGSIHPGFSLLSIGTLTAFFPSRHEAWSMSLVALGLNISFAIVLIAIFNRWKSSVFLNGTVFMGTLCAILLWLRPYSGIEEIYIGYHLWNFSVLWTLWVPVVADGQIG